jgi:hypothetical protein
VIPCPSGAAWFACSGLLICSITDHDLEMACATLGPSTHLARSVPSTYLSLDSKRENRNDGLGSHLNKGLTCVSCTRTLGSWPAVVSARLSSGLASSWPNRFQRLGRATLGLGELDLLSPEPTPRLARPPSPGPYPLVAVPTRHIPRWLLPYHFQAGR